MTGFSANLEYHETHPKYDFPDFGTKFSIDDPREILKIHIQGLFRRKLRLNSKISKFLNLKPKLSFLREIHKHNSNLLLVRVNSWVSMNSPYK